MLMLDTLTRPTVRLLWPILLLAATGCYEDSVVGVSEKPKASERTPSPPRDAPARLSPKLPTVFVGNSRETVGGNNPILGDVDGDGFDDFLIQATHFVDPNGIGESASVVYLFYGRPEFPTQLSTEDADARFISSDLGAAPLGDINGDGLAEFTLGQLRGFEIVFGERTRRHGEYAAYSAGLLWEANALPAPFGEGIATTTMNLRSAGDVNGDGLADVLVGAASMVSPGEEDQATSAFGMVEVTYLVLGHSGEWPAGPLDPSWGDVAFGSARVPLTGSTSLAVRAITPQRAGDLDGDGRCDLIAHLEGSLYLFYGDEELPARIGAEHVDAVLPLTGRGTPPALGDLDGDGADELKMLSDDGHLQLMYGSRQRWSGRVTWTPELTVLVDSPMQGDLVAEVGDIDGNGAPELVVGSVTYDGDFTSELDPRMILGAVYVIRGDGQRLRGEYRLTERDLMRVQSPGLESLGAAGIGATLSLAGDVDGDGNADVLAGAASEGPSDSDAFGAVYLIPSTPKPPD